MGVKGLQTALIVFWFLFGGFIGWSANDTIRYFQHVWNSVKPEYMYASPVRSGSPAGGGNPGAQDDIERSGGIGGGFLDELHDNVYGDGE